MYDSEPREAMWKALQKYGLPPEVVSLVKSFHEGVSANLRIHGEVRDHSDKWVVTGMHCGSNALQPILQPGR